MKSVRAMPNLQNHSFLMRRIRKISLAFLACTGLLFSPAFVQGQDIDPRAPASAPRSKLEKRALREKEKKKKKEVKGEKQARKAHEKLQTKEVRKRMKKSKKKAKKWNKIE
jgi:hypothetical protein